MIPSSLEEFTSGEEYDNARLTIVTLGIETCQLFGKIDGSRIVGGFFRRFWMEN